MKIELLRSVRRIYENTKEEDIEFEITFTPENVEETLKLKELEEIRKKEERNGYYNNKWIIKKFIISLS